MERNYEIYDKEMLAVVRCLEAQRHFLEGMTTKFEIWTDYKNLKYFIKIQKLNKRQAKWALYLFRFDFTLKHVLGSKMEKANSLNRRLDQKVGVERDNEDEMLVKLKWLEVRRTEGLEVIIERVDLLEKVRQLRVKNNKVVKAVEEMKWTGVKMLKDEEQRKINSIIYKEKKVYISKNEKLRIEIIRLYHNTLVEGYKGQQKIVELITRKFW